MKIIRTWTILLTFLLFGNLLATAQTVVEDGKKVKFDYTLTIDGQIVETTEGKTPLEYTHGAGEIIPGLSVQLEGLKVGDTKEIIIEPKDAYGEIVEDAIKEFPMTSFPDDFDPQRGMVIEVRDPEGNAAPGIIWEIKEGAVIINFNHPLAGKTLQFDVKIVSVE
ncbi:MAG: peptidylprolyl isomerase [Candidatus Omnitrophica bacterium]|nr:peptidylprolyl isomerase [Candidatus Omnitrophota bacterium]